MLGRFVFGRVFVTTPVFRSLSLLKPLLPAIAATIESQLKTFKTLNISGVSHSPRAHPTSGSLYHTPVYQFLLSRPVSVNAWPNIWFASRLEIGLPGLR